MKLKKNAPYLLIIISLVIYSCGNNNANQEANTTSTDSLQIGHNNNNFYLNEIDHYLTLYPHSITDLVSANIAYQIYEGLVGFNPKDLNIVPAIAEKWDIDETGTVYTFKLKKGVKFQDDPCFEGGKGREVTANDFKYSFTLLCTQSPDNRVFNSSFKGRVVGADSYFEASAKGKPSFELEGVKVKDDYTLEITLLQHDQSFLNILATIYGSVLPKEGVEKYGNTLKIGTGAFILKEPSNASEVVYLVKNNNYHRKDKEGKKLPYIDTVVVSFLPTKQAELEMFKKQELDYVYGLPSESVNELVEEQIKNFQKNSAKFILNRLPDMSSNYYEFNILVKPFDNVKVRKAFNYAIDREKLVTETLNDQAFGPAVNGITSPTFKDYKTTEIRGYTFDVAKAKKLLAEAGYPDGKGFPTIRMQFNGNNSKNTNVAIEIQKQLFTNLNVNVDLNNVSFATGIENALKSEKANMTKTSWVADYPNHENFLFNFYGKNVPESKEANSFPNSTRYQNIAFDRLFEQGRKAKNTADAYQNFMKAEQIMIDDAPIMPLWYDENYRLLNSRVINFYPNAMVYRNFSEVSLKHN